MTYILFCCRVPIKVYLAYLNIQEFILAAILAQACVRLTDFGLLDDLDTFDYQEEQRMIVNYIIFGFVVILFISASISLIFSGFKTFQRLYQYYRMLFGLAFFTFFMLFFAYYLIGISNLFTFYAIEPFSLKFLNPDMLPKTNKEKVSVVIDHAYSLFAMLILLVWMLMNSFTYYYQDMNKFDEDDYTQTAKNSDLAYRDSSMIRADCKDLTIQL